MAWVMVFSHGPIYNTFTPHRHDIQLVMTKRILETLFVESKVNFFVSGYLHAYMRTLNVIHKTNQTQFEVGPMHISWKWGAPGPLPRSIAILLQTGLL